MSFEDLATLLTAAQGAVWNAEWVRADICRLIVESVPHPSWLVGLQQSTGISHSLIEKWALWAEGVPQEERAQDKAPVTQARAKGLR